MEYFQVRNFERYQHYKDRRPPWVKLYRDLWQDPSFFSLSDQNKLYIIGFFTLASETDNKIPVNIPWIQSRLAIGKRPDFKELFASGFIEPIGKSASSPLASCKQSANVETEVQKYRDTETEVQNPLAPAKEILDFWNSFPSLHHHRTLSAADSGHIRVALESFNPDELKVAIRRYATILADSSGSYWLSTRWTIGEFMSRKGAKWPTVFLSDNWEEQMLTDGEKRKRMKELQENQFWESLERGSYEQPGSG